MYINKFIEKWVDNVTETAYEIDDVVDKMNVEVLRLQVENEFEALQPHPSNSLRLTAFTLNSLEVLVTRERPDLREVVNVAAKLRELRVGSCPEMMCLSIQFFSGTNSEAVPDLELEHLVRAFGHNEL